MTKVNQQTMKTQYNGQYDTFCRKNHDYGNSFEESLDKHGIVASVVRMGDKMNRLESLTDDSRTQQVGSESLLDTLEDLSNYAAMTACWLKGVRAEDGEEEEVTIYADNKPVVTFTDDNENIDPENYIINMLSNIFRVVRMKMEKDAMLVPLDISDEAGLIAKCIIESNTKQEGVAVINKYMCNHKDIPYELKDWIYGVIMRYLYYLEKEQTEAGDELSEAVKETVDMLKKVLEFNYKIEWNRMTEDECVELKHIINRLCSMMTDGVISEELMLDLINDHVKFNPESTINRLFNQRVSKNPNEDVDNKPVVTYVGEGQNEESYGPELADAVREVVTMLKVVFKLHCKIEEFKMTSEDYEGLEHFIDVANNVLKMKDFDHETIGKFENIPPHFRPEYYHSGDILNNKEKLNDN